MSAELDKSLLVIGGADGMPNWLVRRVFGQTEGIKRITLLDIRPIEQIPSMRWLNEINQLHKPIDAIEVNYNAGSDHLVHAWRPIPTQATPPADQLPLSEYDIVMLGVPADQIPITTSSIFPQLNNSSWIFDICSVKQDPIEIMRQHAPKQASVIGTHPLFGPAVPDLIGQIMVMIKTPATNPDHINWQTLLYRDRGALIVDAVAAEHDFYMKYIQGLTHFTYLVFGETLRRAMTDGFDLARSLRFATPPYAAIAAFLSRIAASSPRVYAQIQADPTISSIRESVVNSARSLADSFAGSDEPTIALEIETLANSFHERAITAGASLASSYVESGQSYFRLLQERKTQGELTVVQITDLAGTQRERPYHAGQVVDYDGESLLLRERTLSRDGKLILAYDERSQRGAQRLLKRLGMGLLPKAKETRIYHKRIRILSDQETILWRKLNLLHHEFDIPIIAGDISRLEELIESIPLICPDIISSEMKEQENANWLRRYGLANRLLHFTVYGDRDMAEAQKQVVQLLTGLGLHLHQEVYN